MTVLHKRFPGSPARDIAAAANAIVGLGPEYEAVGPVELDAFECVSDEGRYTLQDVLEGKLRIYRKARPER